MVKNIVKIVGELEFEGNSYEAFLGPPDEAEVEKVAPRTDETIDGKVRERCGIFFIAKNMEKVARYLRIVASRYDAERRDGMTAGKAYRLMWQTFDDMMRDGIVSADKKWTHELLKDMKKRAYALGAGGSRSGEFPQHDDEGDNGISLP